MTTTRNLCLCLCSLALLGACAGGAASRQPRSEPVTGQERAAAVSTAAGGPHAPTAEATSQPVGLGRLAALVAAPGRSPADRNLDAGRKPVELLAFIDVLPGMRVAEIAAGTGYTTELLARAVGPQGAVFGVNNAFVLEKFAEAPWSERLSKPVMANVVRVDREFDDPLPPEAVELDRVCNVLFYHDSVWMQTDRQAMNTAIFDSLRPGGMYIIVDHAAAAGRGVQDAKTLHRIEPATVRAELEAVGFQWVGQSDFLANPDDAHDWNAAPSAAGARRGTSDRFAFKFRKP